MTARNGLAAILVLASRLICTSAVRADDFPPPPPATTIDPMKQLDSRIEALHKEGKDEQAKQLEIERGQAINRVYGGVPLALPEIHIDVPAPTEIKPNYTLLNDIQPASRPAMNASNIPKEQRVKNLMAAAASLKAAGMEQDAGRYARMAAQLAQEGSSAEVIALRHEIDELRGQVEQLRREVERLKSERR